MDEINKSLLYNLKNGQYYLDARMWYMRKYIYPILERSMVGFLSIVLLVTCLLMSYVVYALFPIKAIVPITLRIPNLTESTSVIRKIEQKNEASSVSIAKFLASKYVIWRESYSYDNLDNQLNRIKNNSTKFVFKSFNNYLNLENVNSPVLLYQEHTKRTIDIVSVINSPHEQNIIIKFQAKVKNFQTGQEEISMWLANIAYDMTDIELIMKKNAQLNFIVTDYDVQEIK